MHTARPLPITILLAVSLFGAAFPTTEEAASRIVMGRVRAVCMPARSLRPHKNCSRIRPIASTGPQVAF